MTTLDKHYIPLFYSARNRSFAMLYLSVTTEEINDFDRVFGMSQVGQIRQVLNKMPGICTIIQGAGYDFRNEIC